MTLKAGAKCCVCRSAAADESGFKERIPDFGILPSRFEAFLNGPETVANVEAIVQQVMKKVSDNRGCCWFFGFILDQEHDINIGREAKLLASVSTERDGGDELLVGICKRAKDGTDKMIKTLRQGESNDESTLAPAMELDNRF